MGAICKTNSVEERITVSVNNFLFQLVMRCMLVLETTPSWSAMKPSISPSAQWSGSVDHVHHCLRSRTPEWQSSLQSWEPRLSFTRPGSDWTLPPTVSWSATWRRGTRGPGTAGWMVGANRSQLIISRLQVSIFVFLHINIHDLIILIARHPTLEVQKSLYCFDALENNI